MPDAIQSRKKVLSLNWAFSLGGVAKYNVLLKRVGCFRQIEIDYLCVLSDSFQTDHASLEQLSPTVVNISSRSDLSWIPKCIEAIDKQSPDLIITHGFNGHFLALVLVHIRRKGIPCVISYHGLYHPTTPFRRTIAPLFNWFTEYYAKNYARSVVAVADYCKRHLVEKNVEPSKIKVIHNGLPQIKDFGESRFMLRQEFALDSEQIVLGVVSRLDPVKGIEYFIDALHQLNLIGIDFKVLIVGTGSIEDELRERAVSRGVNDRIVWTGFRTDIAEIFEAIDIFVLPSLAEYHSIALLEAMRAGKAIVSTSVGGNTESIRDGIDGIVVEPADSEALEGALMKLIESEQIRSELSSSAQRRFREAFLEERMVEKTAVWLESQI